MDLNKAMLIGNLTADPELRQTQTGQSVVSFSIATNRTYTDKGGQRVSQAEFHNVVAWGNLAERIQQYCSKGKKVYVEGRLQTRTWEDNNGVKHYKTEIVADNIIFLSRADGSSGQGMMDSVTEVSSGGMSSLPPEEEISIEDVPF